jgi:predicted nucleic acid-binding protein
LILVDTSALAYAVGSEHPLREPCRRLLAAHDRGLVDVTTIEVIQEFTHVRARRRPRSDAVQLARYFAAAYSLLTVQTDDLLLGLSLFEGHPALGAFDAVLAVVAINRRAEALVSADRAFGSIPHLPWIDPLSPQFDRVIRGPQP